MTWPGIGLLAGIAGSAAVLWLIAGFALRLGLAGRYALAVFGPCVLTMAGVFAFLVDERTTSGWAAVLLLLSVVVAALAVLPALAVAYAMEARLGDHVP